MAAQVVECRRVLKWTYAYGFYLPDDDLAKKNFFEYLQGMFFQNAIFIQMPTPLGMGLIFRGSNAGEAEVGLERLHQCAEKDIKAHLDGDAPQEASFTEFRTKLAGLTR